MISKKLQRLGLRLLETIKERDKDYIMILEKYSDGSEHLYRYKDNILVWERNRYGIDIIYKNTSGREK